MTSAFANELFCNRGNGGYFVEYSLNAPLKSVRLTIIDASGVEDASGDIPCDGPQEAAYICKGEIPSATDEGFKGPKIAVNATLGENQLGAGGGLVQIDGNVVSCSAK